MNRISNIKKGESKEIKDPAILKSLMGRDLIPFFNDTTTNNTTHNNTTRNNTTHNNTTTTTNKEVPDHKAWAGFCSPPHHKDIPFPASFIRYSTDSSK